MGGKRSEVLQFLEILISFSRYRMNISGSFFLLSLSLTGLWNRRQETAMFRLTPCGCCLMFDNQTSPRTGLLKTFLPGVLGEPVVCPPNTNSEPSWDEMDGEMDEGMQGRKMFSVSSTQASISLLHTAHRESVQTLLTC